jgi:hypothetical protein
MKRSRLNLKYYLVICVWEGGSENPLKNLSQDSQCPDPDSNPPLPNQNFRVSANFLASTKLQYFSSQKTILF